MISLAIAYLRDRPLTTALNVLLLAIAVAMLVLLLQFASQANDRLSRDAREVDLVVGAKGSPLQLILSSVFHVDQPTGNIPLSSLDLLRRDPAVARAVPLALGDNFDGYRIVGTDETMLDLYQATLSNGRFFDESLEVVLGAEVASHTGAALGQRFVGSHGLGVDETGEHGHESTPFTTVGILKPTGTVVDRLILTSVESVWDVHGIGHDHDHDHGEGEHAREHDEHAHEEGADHAHDHGDTHDHAHHDDHDHGEDHGHDHGDEDAHVHDHSDEPVAVDPPDGQSETRPILQADSNELEPELTALLVTYRNASGAVRIPAMIDRQTQLQAAVPATETARLLELLGASLNGMRLFAWLLAATGGLAIFVALLNMARSREGDLALLRVMGASRMQVFSTVILEGVITAAMGAALGWVGAHMLILAARAVSPTLSGLGLQAWHILPSEAGLLLAVVAIGALAALIPAIRVYRIDPAPILARA